MSGWSSKGLLITDRKAFSTRDGATSWSTLEQAEEGLVSFGWEWDGDATWVVDTNFPGTDAEGWSYDVNFGTFESASPVKSMMHFVRRRRRSRNVRFIASRFFTGTCDHCDLAERDKLASKLLQVMATVSSRDGGRTVSESKIYTLKNRLLELVNLAPAAERMPIFNLYSRIDAFPESNKSMWRQASTSMGFKDENQETISNHLNDLESRFFQLDERNEIATILLRKHDTLNEYHCNTINCGNECIFRPIKCPNAGCPDTTSFKWCSAHDELCPYKVVECKRCCGDSFARRAMDSHLQHACPLRPVMCPFHDMGCNITELTHRALPDHMETCTQSHLMLLLNRVVEQQSVIVATNNRVTAMETLTAAHVTAIAAIQGAISANTTALETAERRVLKTSHDEMGQMEKRLNRTSSSLQTEVNTLKTSIERMGKDVHTLHGMVTKKG